MEIECPIKECEFTARSDEILGDHIAEEHRQECIKIKNEINRCQHGCGSYVGKNEFECSNGHDNIRWWVGRKLAALRAQGIEFDTENKDDDE